MNPRDPFESTRVPGVRLKPLGHLSARAVPSMPFARARLPAESYAPFEERGTIADVSGLMGTGSDLRPNHPANPTGKSTAGFGLIILDQRKTRDRRKPLAAFERIELDHEGASDDFAADLVREPNRRERGASRRQQIIDDQHT